MNWGINNIIKFVIKFRFDEGDWSKCDKKLLGDGYCDS